MNRTLGSMVCACALVVSASASGQITKGGPAVRYDAAGKNAVDDATWRTAEGGGVIFNAAAAALTGSDKIVQPSMGSREWEPVTLKGPIPGASSARFVTDLGDNVVTMSTDGLKVGKIPTTSADPKEKQYRPGSPSIGNVTFGVRRPAPPAITAWRTTALQGLDARKTINVELRGAGGEVLRKYTLQQCQPVSFSGVSVKPGVETLDTVVAHCVRVDVAGAARPGLVSWMTSFNAGADYRRNVTVVDGPRRFSYGDAWILEYGLPPLDKRIEGEAVETLVFQPTTVSGP